jgi:hypothetical protein
MAERAPEAARQIIPVDPYIPASQPTSAQASKDPYATKRDHGRPSMESLADNDPIERSGQAVVALLQKAAETANANAERAMDLAQKLSLQLRAAEERMRDIELDMRHYQDRGHYAEQRAQRAEKWLVRIYKDIDEKFFEQKKAPDQPAQR